MIVIRKILVNISYIVGFGILERYINRIIEYSVCILIGVN